MDFVKELGCLGFTMRLKRLSDSLMHDGRKLYNALDMDLEPNWYVVFRLLKREAGLSVTEIAEKIQLAHPSVISITNKMIKAGYLISTPCQNDHRRRGLNLTSKAMEKLPEFEQIWDAGERGIFKALEGTDALKVLETLEDRFSQKGFKDRTLYEIQHPNTAKLKPNNIKVLPYEDQYGPDFARLNYEWLETYFEIEDHDREMLDSPYNNIIKPGGKIFFAQANDEIVGTVALIVEDPESYELAKMAVQPDYRGKKIGKQLLEHAINEARNDKKRRLVLESNTKLPTAINLYINSGFKVAPLKCSPYSRCNIRMELLL